MHINELISLANLLDKKGEFEAANEVDQLIKKMAVDPEDYRTNPTVEELGWGRNENDPVVTGLDEPTENYPSQTQKSSDDVLEHISKATEDLQNAQDLSDEVKTELAKVFDRAYRIIMSERVLNEHRAKNRMANVFTQLSKIADDLDNIEATKEADMIDGFIKKYAAEPMEDEPTRPYPANVGKPFEEEYDTEINVELKEVDNMLYYIKKALKSLGQTQSFFNDQDRLEINKRLNQLENIILSARTMNEYKDKGNASIFTQLSKIADELDNVGAVKEADIVDGFIRKYAVEPMENEPTVPDPEKTEPNVNAPRFIGEEKTQSHVSIMDLIKSLNHTYDNLKATSELPEEVKAHLEKLLNEAERIVYSRYTDTVGEEVKRMDELNQLSNASDSLDSAGYVKEADMIDEFIQKYADIMDYSEGRKEEGDTEQAKRYDSKYHHSLQIREPKRDQERVDREGRKEHHINTYKPHEGSLSTRYCPEHLGVHLARIGPGVFQCSLDGGIFNFDTGYTTFDGKQVPGGSVAAQTPDSTGYAIPHRIFDSREKTLNVIH